MFSSNGSYCNVKYFFEKGKILINKNYTHTHDKYNKNNK